LTNEIRAMDFPSDLEDIQVHDFPLMKDIQMKWYEHCRSQHELLKWYDDDRSSVETDER